MGVYPLRRLSILKMYPFGYFNEYNEEDLKTKSNWTLNKRNISKKVIKYFNNNIYK